MGTVGNLDTHLGLKEQILMQMKDYIYTNHDSVPHAKEGLCPAPITSLQQSHRVNGSSVGENDSRVSQSSLVWVRQSSLVQSLVWLGELSAWARAGQLECVFSSCRCVYSTELLEWPQSRHPKRAHSTGVSASCQYKGF